MAPAGVLKDCIFLSSFVISRAIKASPSLWWSDILTFFCHLIFIFLSFFCHLYIIFRSSFCLFVLLSVCLFVFLSVLTHLSSSKFILVHCRSIRINLRPAFMICRLCGWMGWMDGIVITFPRYILTRVFIFSQVGARAILLRKLFGFSLQGQFS